MAQPSAKREGFATVPDVKWEDVGSLGDVRDELNLSICEPILNPGKFKALGLSAPTGVLLYGPPGCGKTLVAKAVARESGANFISVKGPELLNKFVGESERAVRTLFLRAEASSPCVIFFDELDALCPKRGGEGGVSSERVVNQLLTEMDGLNSRKSVFIIAATNRPDMIDAAMLRPGRLDKLLYVRLPKQVPRLVASDSCCLLLSLCVLVCQRARHSSMRLQVCVYARNCGKDACNSSHRVVASLQRIVVVLPIFL
jgi:ribosome biogenesis ATPase